MSKYANGFYQLLNPEKYVGINVPMYRSSWEFSFMNFCDTNPNILKWASEAIKIPYRNPLTGKQTVYVPDFFIQYIDKNNKIARPHSILKFQLASKSVISDMYYNKCYAGIMFI